LQEFYFGEERGDDDKDDSVKTRMPLVFFLKMCVSVE